ncbi:unnamed protein product [Adineta steineri]|uniref:G-protein coupled receptors family 1 profile domain-containing protein n=1 Tax=Adineta steineri TaxID=433720 RepID=A0A815LHY7_9BILA|nr:unnamed protein product [Adineta steineri]
MSSSLDYNAYLALIEKNLYAIGGPIIIILGTICSIISLFVFCQKKLRKNPCAIYFISINISNLFYIYSSILIISLSFGYNIDLSSYNIITCRLLYYCSLLFDCLSAFYLILASLDRVLVTSPNALTRQRSTLHLAYKSVIIGTLFWMLFHSHTLFLVDFYELAPGYFVCYFQPGLYANLIGYYSTIVRGILMFALLIIFGIWTGKNLQNVNRHRIIPIAHTSVNTLGNQENIIRSKTRQFALMLLMEILINIVFYAMLSITGIYEQIATSESQTTFYYFIRLIASFIGNIPLCASFMGNLFISKTFRSEVKRILSCN